MTDSNKKINYLILIVAILAFVLGVYNAFYVAKDSKNLGSVLYNTNPTFVSASSTTFTLTTASQRILATTTTPRRLSATVQPVNCSAGGFVYMNAGSDAAAKNASGTVAFASTTFAFQDYPNTPVVQGSVQALTSAGTCTVLVTEWVSRY